MAGEVPEPQKRSIERVTQKLRLRHPDAKWVPRESWHVTLKFLGWVDDERLNEVATAGRKAATESHPFETRLTEMGAFQSERRARVVWVGLDDSTGHLDRLAGSFERRYAKRGFKKESRKYHPHLTLARFRIPQAIELDESGPYDFDRSPFVISRVVLFQSHLSSKGAAYEAVDYLELPK